MSARTRIFGRGRIDLTDSQSPDNDTDIGILDLMIRKSFDDRLSILGQEYSGSFNLVWLESLSGASIKNQLGDEISSFIEERERYSASDMFAARKIQRCETKERRWSVFDTYDSVSPPRLTNFVIAMDTLSKAIWAAVLVTTSWRSMSAAV